MSRCRAKVPLGGLVLSAVLCAPTRSQASDFADGVEFMSAQNYGKALGAFEEFLQRDASSVGALINLAVCYEHLAQPEKAWETWERAVVVARAKKDRRLVKALAELALAEQRLTWLLVVVPPEARLPKLRISVDGLPIELNREFVWRRPVAAAKHRVDVEAPGHNVFSDSFQIESKETFSFTVPMLQRPLPAPSASARPGLLDAETLIRSTDSSVMQLGELTKRLLNALDESKSRGDVVRSLCLKDKAQQARLARDTAEERRIDLRQAFHEGDTDRVRHEFTVVQLLRERGKTLLSEGEQCAGDGPATIETNSPSAFALRVSLATGVVGRSDGPLGGTGAGGSWDARLIAASPSYSRGFSLPPVGVWLGGALELVDWRSSTTKSSFAGVLGGPMLDLDWSSLYSSTWAARLLPTGLGFQALAGYGSGWLQTTEAEPARLELAGATVSASASLRLLNIPLVDGYRTVALSFSADARTLAVYGSSHRAPAAFVGGSLGIGQVW